MLELIVQLLCVEVVGTKLKLIDEYVGWVNIGEEWLSIVCMRLFVGWVEFG